MKKIIISLIFIVLLISINLYATTSNSKDNSLDPVLQLQQQVKELQEQIHQIQLEEATSTKNTSAFSTDDSALHKDTYINKYLEEKDSSDILSNVSPDSSIINLDSETDSRGLFDTGGDRRGIDVGGAPAITTRGETTYMGSYSGNNSIPIGQISSKLFASTLLSQKQKFDSYSVFLGAFLGMDAQTWFGDTINRVDFSNNPTTPFPSTGENIYLTSARLFFVSNVGEFVTAAYDVSTSETGQFFIGDAFAIFGNMSMSPFFVTAGRSTLSVANLGGGGTSTGSIAGFLGTGRATNVSLNYKTDTLNMSVAVFGTDDQQADFSTGLFYADSWTNKLSVGFNTGYVYNLNGAENFSISRVSGDTTIGAFNVDANVAYSVGPGILQGTGGWATTTNSYDFNGTGSNVFAGAWYVASNYSLKLAGKNTNFNVTYGQTYNAATIPMAIAASPLQAGLSESGIQKQLIFSAQRAYFDNNVLFGPEWAYQAFYDSTHMNTITLDIAVYV